METENTENKVHKLRQALESATAQLNQVRQILDDLGVQTDMAPSLKVQIDAAQPQAYEGNSQIVEGVFNGQNMVGPDGKIYTVPANYASKSKLVEGDFLKLTIRPDGSFMYKQVGPVERKRVVGTLVYDPETTDFTVMVQEKAYKVIKASVTYFKGNPGDEVVLLVPEDSDSVWGAVENVIGAGESADVDMEEDEEGATEEEVVLDTTHELASGDDAQLQDGADAQLEDGQDDTATDVTAFF